MTHREAAAALHAEIGGTLRHEQFTSAVLLPPSDARVAYFPWLQAATFDGASWYITISGADDDLTRAIAGLVKGAREKVTGP